MGLGHRRRGGAAAEGPERSAAQLGGRAVPSVPAWLTAGYISQGREGDTEVRNEKTIEQRTWGASFYGIFTKI